MPAEWAPHEGTWLAWPHEKTDWPGKFAPIPWLYGDIVRHLAQVERVRIVVESRETQESVRKILKKCHVELAAVDFVVAPTDRSWVRDTMAIFVHNAKGKVEATDWSFNAWAKYDNYAHDDALPGVAAWMLNVKRHEPMSKKRRVVLEGGSIEVNGAGWMLTTEECLLSDVQARNPGLTREEIEAAFAKYLGIEKTIWLKNGIVGDDTHGHIDDLARFTDESTVVVVQESDKNDDNYEALRENLAILKQVKGLKVATLPMPEPVFFGGQRLPASYANFYIANDIVLAPVFNDARDREALNTLAKLFPTRRIIPIYCRDLVLGLGTLHCMTQQEPRPRTIKV
ncbi:agmatine deiminase family protein [Bryobacter aggregatus]|uniref:agmatine deiminase family protein n=1 Tax=Bryobacter aggregatus TaxID=360054 RepID=UPI000A7B33BB|nr:agmatine deiminase family protein [Bryobacter aggregatus]